MTFLPVNDIPRHHITLHTVGTAFMNKPALFIRNVRKLGVSKLQQLMTETSNANPGTTLLLLNIPVVADA